MKDRFIWGILPGLVTPLLVVLLFWYFRFNYLSLNDFIQQTISLRIQFKIIAIGVFFADLALFYLFLHYNKITLQKVLYQPYCSMPFIF